MKRILTGFLAVTLSTSAAAANWVPVANCGDTDQMRLYSYDAASVRTIDEARSVRIRGDYSRHATSQAREATMLWSFDCKARTFREASREELDAGGKLIGNFRTPTGPMVIMPESVADKVFAVVCA